MDGFIFDPKKLKLTQANRDAKRLTRGVRKAERLRKREEKRLLIQAKRDSKLRKKARREAKTVSYLLSKRAKARKAALSRRMKDSPFKARYKQKILGRRFREGGRILGQTYRIPLAKRQKLPHKKGYIHRTSRVQKGPGLAKAGSRVNMTGAAGPWAVTASLIDYAEKLRQKAQAAYLKKVKKQAVRIPMNKQQKAKRRSDAYKLKKQTTQLLQNLPLAPASSLPSPVFVPRSSMSPMPPMPPMPPMIVSISPPGKRQTRANSALKAKKASRKASRKAKENYNRRPKPGRVLRSSVRPTTRASTSISRGFA